MAIRTIDQDAPVFYEISRLQHLLETITVVVGDMPYERNGEIDEEMHRLNSLTWIASDMLERISAAFDADFKAQALASHAGKSKESRS